MRVIVYTGKGGVGKTSIAAATAVRLAREGRRTLVMSTDAAHSLSDSLCVPLASEPTQVAERLWGLEVDSLVESEKHWGVVRDWLSRVLSWADLDGITSEEMVIFPGMEELFSLMEIRRHATGGQFDVVIVDCAPTGETLRLLGYPDLIRWWLDRILPYQRRALKVARPVVKVATRGLELPGDSVVDGIEALARDVQALHEIIADEGTTSIRMVVNPERMVIEEARRAFTYLNLFGFNTDAVIVNRLLPDEAGSGYWSTWRDIHRKYDAEIVGSFHPLPILRVPLLETEVLGLAMLARMGEIAFGTADPAAVMHRGVVQKISREGQGYVLELSVPFLQRDQLLLSQRGDELTIQAGPYKRKVFLPRFLQGKPIAGAAHADQRLSIRFGPPAGSSPG